MYVIINKLVYNERFRLIMILQFKDDCNRLGRADCRCSTNHRAHSVIINYIYEPIKKTVCYGIE